MKVFLIVFSFIFFSFLGAEEPASAQDQSKAADETQAVEAKTETSGTAPAEQAEPVNETKEAPANEIKEAPVNETKEAPANDETKEAPANEIKEAAPASDNEPKVADNSGKQGTETVDEQGYDLKLRTLEEKIESLKDKIFRAKQRLSVLQESVGALDDSNKDDSLPDDAFDKSPANAFFSGSLANSGVKIIHKNTVGELFKMNSAVFYLDDKQIFERNDATAENEFDVYEGAAVAGSHNLSAFYVFEGKGYGLFSYLKNYTFKLNDEYPFTVEDGNLVEITVSPADKGMTHNFKNRLYIVFNTEIKPYEGLASEGVVLESAEPDATVSIVQKNTVGELFKLVSASYSLDNEPVYSQLDSPETFKEKETKIYSGEVPSGRHIVKADCVFKGNGYGLFTYMRGYTFKVSGIHSFRVEKDSNVEVVASLKDKGASYNVNHRLQILFTANATAKPENKVDDRIQLTSSEPDATVSIVQKNTVGAMFKMVSATYSLDKSKVYETTDSPETFEAEELNIYEGEIPAGRHLIETKCVFKGNGYGVFSYMKGYTFNVEEDYVFEVETGGRADVVSTLEDKGAGFNVNHRLKLSFSGTGKSGAPENGNSDQATAQEE